MNISKARSKDALDIYDLECEIFKGDPFMLSLASIQYHIKNNELYIVCIDDIIVAYALFLKRKKGYRLYSLATKKDFQKRGIAKKLLQFFLENFSYGLITLEVKIRNKKAIALYEALGFRKKEILKDFYEDCDGILMELKKELSV